MDAALPSTQMDVVPPAQLNEDQRADWQQVDRQAKRRGQLSVIGAELQRAAGMLHDERARAIEEQARSNEVLRGIAHSLVGLQYTLAGLEAGEREL